jgi:hypothetical protein
MKIVQYNLCRENLCSRQFLTGLVQQMTLKYERLLGCSQAILTILDIAFGIEPKMRHTIMND